VSADNRPRTPGFLVGFAAEARIARRSGWPVGIGGGSSEGAARAAEQLVRNGAAGLVSFGLAGGLDPSLPAGTLIVADAVVSGGKTWRADPELIMRLGGSTGHRCLSVKHIVASSAEKQRLWRDTGASAVDMESDAAATIAGAAGIPFAVLRAICDTAERELPPAALVALDAAGRLAFARVAWSVLTVPKQIGALTALARASMAARKALRSRLDMLRL
jgi:adenosylhomocysteine nucleosidase